MAAVSLLRAGYEKQLRDERERRKATEEQWRRTNAERTQLLQEREALRRILLGVTVDARQQGGSRRRECERHARSRSAEGRLPQPRTLEGRATQLREEIDSQRRLLSQMEGELLRRDEAIREMEEESASSRERERVLVDRLQEAVQLREGGEETERILRAELDYAQSRLAAVSSSGRVQHQAAEDAVNYDLAANEGVLQRLQEVEALLAENEEREMAQARILEEMREQMSLVIAERDEALSKVRRLENKYEKAKADVARYRDAVERLTDAASPSGRLSDGVNALQRARELHAATEAAAAAQRDRERERGASPDRTLMALVEDERAIARSLHEDLDATRKMLLDRDAEVYALAAELSDVRISLSAALTEAEMERGRAEEASAVSHADTTAYANAFDESERENETLRQRLADSLKQSASYAAKLEAQGRDLIAVKKELQRLQLQQS